MELPELINSYEPNYEHNPENLNLELFQIYSNLVNLSNLDFEFTSEQIQSPFYILLIKSLEEYSQQDILIEFILRKYLIIIHNIIINISSTFKISSISLIYNELTNVFKEFQKININEKNFEYLNLLIGETLDLFNSKTNKIADENYWKLNKSSTEIIQEFLLKEIEILRLLSIETFQLLSNSLIKRSIETAPSYEESAILLWAKKENII